MNKLSQIDKLNFTYRKPAKADIQETPKTLVDNLTLADHRKLVVHQVADWLESIYTPAIKLDQIEAKITDKEDELLILQVVFE